MALSGITYKPPYVAITSASITPIAGTGWAAGTWDFCVIVAQTGPTNAGTRESPPKYVNGVVLNGSQGVQLDIVWDASHTTTEYVFMWGRRNAGSWTYIKYLDGFTGLQYPNTTRQFATYYNYTYCPCVAVMPTIFPVDNQQGAGLIELGNTGASTTYTLKQIFDDMFAAGLLSNTYTFYNRYNLFIGCWTIRTASDATGKLNMTGFFLWMYGIIFNHTSYYPYTLPGISGTELKPFKNGGSLITIYLYNAVLYGTTIDSGTYNMSSYYVGNLQFMPNAATRLVNCRVHSTYPRLDFPYTYDGTTAFGSYLMCISEVSTYTTPINMWGFCLFYYNNNTYKLRDCTFRNPMTITKFLQLYLPYDNPSQKVHKLLDCLFIQYTSPTNFTELSRYDYPIAIAYNNIPSGRYEMTHIEHSINLTLRTEEGNALEGVTLNIYDKDSVLVATGTSASTGIISEIILVTKKIQYIPGSTQVTGEVSGLEGTYHTVNRRYPFTFEFSKDGYLNHSLYYATLEEKISATVALKKTIPSIIGIGITDCTAIGKADGRLEITTESDYDLTFSIDGENYQDSNIFGGLPAGEYTIYVKDSNNAMASMGNIEILEPLLEYLPVRAFNVGIETINIASKVALREMKSFIRPVALESKIYTPRITAEIEISPTISHINQVNIKSIIKQQ